MKISFLFIALAFITVTDRSRAQSVAASNGAAPGYTIQNHPALLALSHNAPRNAEGSILNGSSVAVESLTNPLSGRLTLRSRDGQSFTIVPKDSILIGVQCHFAAQTVGSKIPSGIYVSLPQFLKHDGTLLDIVPLTAGNQGRHSLTEAQILDLSQRYAEQLILLVDRSSGWPIARLNPPPSTP